MKETKIFGKKMLSFSFGYWSSETKKKKGGPSIEIKYRVLTAEKWENKKKKKGISWGSYRY